MVTNTTELPLLRPKITAPLLASYYQLGYNVVGIAESTGYTHQHISQKTKKLGKYIQPLLQGNAHAAFTQKYLGIRYQEEAEYILDTCGKYGKKEFKTGHLLQLNTAASQCIDKGRLYNNEATEIMSQAVNDSNIKDLGQSIKDKLAKLHALTGSHDLVPGEIVDV